jgi:hypothetical protein
MYVTISLNIRREELEEEEYSTVEKNMKVYEEKKKKIKQKKLGRMVAPQMDHKRLIPPLFL